MLNREINKAGGKFVPGVTDYDNESSLGRYIFVDYQRKLLNFFVFVFVTPQSSLLTISRRLKKIYRIRDRFTLLENCPENLIKNLKLGSSC